MAVAGGDIGNAGAMGGYNPLDPLGLGLGGNISLSSSAPVNPKAGSGTASNIPLSGNVNIMDRSSPSMQESRLRDRISSKAQSLRSQFDAMGQRVLGNTQRRNILAGRASLLGGVLMSGSVQSAVGAFQEGNPLGGVANIAATAGTAALGSRLGRGRGALAQAAIGLGTGLISGGLGQAAEDGVGKLLGKGESQGAQRTKMKKDAATQAEITKMLIAAGMDPYVAAQKDLGKYFAELDIENMKRQAPIIKKQLDNAMVRQQSLNASNAQNYMAMGTVATAGQLALGSQAQAGENFRTAITANPYSNSTLQAPNINFG